MSSKKRKKSLTGKKKRGAPPDLLFKPLEECLRRLLTPVHAANLRILPAAFGADSGLIGAVTRSARARNG